MFPNVEIPLNLDMKAQNVHKIALLVTNFNVWKDGGLA